MKVTVPTAGTLSATAKKGSRLVAKASSRKVKAGSVSLALKRTKAGRRTHGRVTVRVVLRSGGAERQATVAVKLP